MRILYNGCVYNCTDNTTIKNMISYGGKEIKEEKSDVKIELTQTKARGKKKK